jgi:hypothetical protein
MIQNITCQSCGEQLVNTDFYCSLRCWAEDQGVEYGPDEKQEHVESFNSSLT